MQAHLRSIHWDIGRMSRFFLQFLFATVAAVIVGLGIALMGVKAGLLAALVFCVPLLIYARAEHLLLSIAVFVYLLMGPIGYLTKISLYWIPFLVGATLYVVLAIEALRSDAVTDPRKPFAFSLQGLGMLVFTASLAVSTAVYSDGFLSFLGALRDYFFLFSVYLAASVYRDPKTLLKKYWILVLVVFFCQVPMVLYQSLVIVPGRLDATRWDAVVGTFIGNAEHGGDSGGMAVFLFSQLAIGYFLLRAKYLPLWVYAAMVAVTVLFVAMAEVKIAAVLVVLTILGIQLASRRLKLLSLLFYTVIALMLSGLILFAYDQINLANQTSTRFSANMGLIERLEYTMRYTLDPDQVGIGQARMVGRIAAIMLWWNHNDPLTDPLGYFLGNGMGALATSRDGLGVVYRKFYPLAVDTNAVAVLLWESGVVGFSGFCLFLAALYRKAYVVIQRADLSPFELAVMRGIFVALPMYIVTLPYTKSVVRTSPPTQFTLLLFCGLVALYHRRLPSGRPKRQSANTPS
jgi:hypothetical protein